MPAFVSCFLTVPVDVHRVGVGGQAFSALTIIMCLFYYYSHWTLHYFIVWRRLRISGVVTGPLALCKLCFLSSISAVSPLLEIRLIWPLRTASLSCLLSVMSAALGGWVYNGETMLRKYWFQIWVGLYLISCLKGVCGIVRPFSHSNSNYFRILFKQQKWPSSLLAVCLVCRWNKFVFSQPCLCK